MHYKQYWQCNLKKNMRYESCEQVKESLADTTAGATDSFALKFENQ